MVKFNPNLPVSVTDSEIAQNYALFGFKSIETGKVESVEIFGSDGRLSKNDAEWLRHEMKARRTIGFNSIPYDCPVIYAALCGAKVKTLKRISDAIIIENVRPWTLEHDFGFKISRSIDHIDLMEVAPGRASLKVYNGRLHGKWMQDLPYDPDATLSDRQIEKVYEYWVNDLDSTIGLWDALREQIDLRTSMSIEYGEDLRSKSDAQVAEAVIKKEVTDILGEMPKRPSISQGSGYRYKAPDFIQFYSDELIDILDMIEDSWFRVGASGHVTMPDAFKNLEIKIGKGKYRMGIGGLHSSEECQAVVADEDHFLRDFDVTSYYPAIIINTGLHPKHLGWAFLKVYKRLVTRRVQAKKEGKKVVADSLKIAVNGSFGKFGSKFSCLYSPDLVIKTTITGQLALLMFIESVERMGASVVSANTDGVVIRCPRHLEDKLMATAKRWEKTTGFALESAEYDALYSRDVNSYVAIKKDGGAKLKGAFSPSDLMRNPSNDICLDAIVAYITEGKSLYKTIRECRDIRKFVTIRTVKGGAVWNVTAEEVERFGKRGNKLKPGVRYILDGADYLGKTIRFYYSTEVSGAIHYKINGNKVPRSDNAKPLMVLPDRMPSDIDYSWYVRECRGMLKAIGYEPDFV